MLPKVSRVVKKALVIEARVATIRDMVVSCLRREDLLTNLLNFLPSGRIDMPALVA